MNDAITRVFDYSVVNLAGTLLTREKKDKIEPIGIAIFTMGEILYSTVSKFKLLPYQREIFAGLFQAWGTTFFYENISVSLIDGFLAFLASLQIFPLKSLNFNKKQEEKK
jgi:hypothetical protein